MRPNREWVYFSCKFAKITPRFCKKIDSFAINWVFIDLNEMKKILVICIGNSCRSQMAHGYLASLVPEGTEIYSAGISPDGLNPRAVAILKEDGIDISQHTSNSIEEYAEIEFDCVITLCDSVKAKCESYWSTATRLHQHFLDPWNARGTEEEVNEVFRSVRDQLKAYCSEFVTNFV